MCTLISILIWPYANIWYVIRRGKWGFRHTECIWLSHKESCACTSQIRVFQREWWNAGKYINTDVPHKAFLLIQTVTRHRQMTPNVHTFSYSGTWAGNGHTLKLRACGNIRSYYSEAMKGLTVQYGLVKRRSHFNSSQRDNSSCVLGYMSSSSVYVCLKEERRAVRWEERGKNSKYLNRSKWESELKERKAIQMSHLSVSRISLFILFSFFLLSLSLCLSLSLSLSFHNS